MPPDEQDAKVLLHRLNSIDSMLERITKSIDRLVIVEERQAQMHAAVERSFRSIEGLEERVIEIERRLPEVTRTSKWVDLAVYGLAGAGLMYVLKKTGLL